MRNMLLIGAAAGYVAWQALRPRYDFRNRTVIITGGSRGLGLVMARQLACAGARLGLMARDEAELARAVSELRETGAVISATVGDLKDRIDIRRFISESRRNLGPIDVLINNAGIIGVGPLDTMTEEDFEIAMQTHFWATLHTSLEVIPEMKARGEGRILNIASFGGKVAIPHMLPYTASKFAQVGLSNGMRTELARYGIVVTTVCPGMMRTGSHIHAEFKGQNNYEYAWFSLGNALPGLSISAETAARKALAACARGDAELILTLPAKLAVAIHTICPNFFQAITEGVNRFVLPDSGGMGKQAVKGKDSRDAVPEKLTARIDRAAFRNNEVGRAPMAVDHR